MKKLLGITLLILTLVFTLASCDTVKSIIIKHEVTLNLDGGSVGEDYADTVEIGDGKTLTLPTPTREGYDFLGWYSGETKITEDTPITADMTLVAKWEIKSFTVSFIDYYGNTVSTQTVNYGESATAPAVDGIINNQRFEGWSVDFSNITEDLTVNAVYVDNTYTISYNLGEIGESFTEPCFYGELPSVPETPIVDGHVFCGWYTDAELTDRYFFDYILDKEITLYAKFYDTSLGEYIVISNVEQLMAIADAPDAKYLLACDINCKGEQLTPITEFSGELEGNGYKIHNFSINETGDTAGFIVTNKGTVANLSFSDFIFDVLVTSASNKSYGLLAANNEGSIINCHILDSEIRIDLYTTLSAGNTRNCYIGAIAGHNYGSILNCSNKSSINAITKVYPTSVKSNASLILNSTIGGIAGTNEAEAVISKCENHGNIFSITKAGGFSWEAYYWVYVSNNGHSYLYCGGVVGFNLGSVDTCANTADVTAKTEFLSSNYRAIYGHIGGAFGRNEGNIDSTYSTGNITHSGAATEIRIGGFSGINKGEITNAYSSGDIAQTGTTSALYLGGFVTLNEGKIYNCYTSTDVISDSTAVTSVGGFATENTLVSGYPALINKCFSTGSITLAAAPTDSGYFVAKTTGTERDCYYLDTMTINVVTTDEVTEGETVETVETVEPVTPTCTVGEAKSESELLSAEFIENTLYFDRMIWLVVDGQLPTLR